MKPKYKEIKTRWEVLLEYYLSFRCPYCKKFLDDMQFDINEGDKINKLIKCPECEKKFRLKVDEV
jgi:hypothetical protein